MNGVMTVMSTCLTINTKFCTENSRARDSDEETDEDEELTVAVQNKKSKLSPVCYSIGTHDIINNTAPLCLVANTYNFASFWYSHTA